MNADIDGTDVPETTEGRGEAGRLGRAAAIGAEPSGGRAPDVGSVRADAAEDVVAPASVAKGEYPAHSDGVVCRCAVHWRRETIARGLDRLFAESEEASAR
jgi:hypothetical protein